MSQSLIHKKQFEMKFHCFVYTSYLFSVIKKLSWGNNVFIYMRPHDLNDHMNNFSHAVKLEIFSKLYLYLISQPSSYVTKFAKNVKIL